MNITVKDDEGTTEEVGAGSEISLAVGTLLPKGVNRRVITIERPVEKTPGEKLCDCFADASPDWIPWRHRTESSRAEYEKAAKLFTDRHLSSANRDWEERRTFYGRLVGDALQTNSLERYSLSSLVGWSSRQGLGETIPLLRVTVDRLKEP